MTGLNRALRALALAGLVAGGASMALTMSSDHVPNPGVTSAIGLTITWKPSASSNRRALARNEG